MRSREILDKYFNFFEERGHKRIPNSSLVPRGDSSLLYVNSGMFPLVPYLSGESHPLGKRLVNVQRCLRFFEDLDNVGVTNRHTTGFHMIGNWSLGDYFKEDQLNWVYEFFVEKLCLDINRMYATVFAGDEHAPKDHESVELLKKVFKKYGITAKEDERIFACGREDNWWKRGEAEGELGGPSSEVFYYIGEEGTGAGKNPAEYQDDFLEIGNSVFMQYKLNKDLRWEEMSQKNVDFGGGLERIALVAQRKRDIYETDNFYPIVKDVEKISGLRYGGDFETNKAIRVVSDHARSAVFLAMDGVKPLGKDQGYILRRLVRRMVRYGNKLGIQEGISVSLVGSVVDNFAWLYPELRNKKESIESIFVEEETRFRNTLKKAGGSARKTLETFKGNEGDLSETAFNLYQSLGYPPEVFVEDAVERGLKVDDKKFWELYDSKLKGHRDVSRKSADQRFKL